MKNKQMESLTDEKKKFSHDFLKPENATESKSHHKSPSKETAFGMGLEQEGFQSTPFPTSISTLAAFPNFVDCIAELFIKTVCN